MLYVLRTVIFSLERAIKRSADAELEKERVQRDKNGNMNNVAFYAVSSSSLYGYLCPKLKHKSQNTEVTSFEHRTQNICIQNTMSHIGFRTKQQLLMFYICTKFRACTPNILSYSNAIIFYFYIRERTSLSILHLFQSSSILRCK